MNMSNVISTSVNIKLFMRIIVSFIFIIISYKTNILSKITFCLIYWMVYLGIDGFSVSIINTINSVNNIDEILYKGVLRLEHIIFAKVCLISLIPVLKIIKLRVNIKKREFVYIIIPLLGNMISFVFVFTYLFTNPNTNDLENIVILIISIILLLSNLSLVFVTNKIVKDSELKSENTLIKEKIDMQYKYYLSIKENQEETRKLYHDMKNHILCIENLKYNNIDTSNYIDKIKKGIDICKPKINTNNMILDVILNEKKKVCDENNIRMTVDINFLKCNFIDVVDICSIFSNIIDNAIEACKKIDDDSIQRKIKIRGSVINKFFVIKCENTKVNDIIIKNGRLITNKKNEIAHGVGINSVEKSVKKYDGNLKIDYSINEFKIKIFIPI